MWESVSEMLSIQDKLSVAKDLYGYKKELSLNFHKNKIIYTIF